MVFLIVLLGLGVFKILPSVVSFNRESANLKQKIDEANNSMAEAEKSKEYLQNPNYLERQARLRLNYKKPDEKVVFIYQSHYNQNSEINSNKSQGLFEILKNWFAGFVQW